MGCVVVVLALMLPRVVMVIAWLLTDWFAEAYNTRFWPILGFLCMPYTTLAYMAAMLKNNHQLGGFWLVLLVVAVIFDLGHWSSASRHRGPDRRRRK